MRVEGGGGPLGVSRHFAASRSKGSLILHSQINVLEIQHGDSFVSIPTLTFKMRLGETEDGRDGGAGCVHSGVPFHASQNSRKSFQLPLPSSQVGRRSALREVPLSRKCRDFIPFNKRFKERIVFSFWACWDLDFFCFMFPLPVMESFPSCRVPSLLFDLNEVIETLRGFLLPCLPYQLPVRTHFFRFFFVASNQNARRSHHGTHKSASAFIFSQFLQISHFLTFRAQSQAIKGIIAESRLPEF